MIKKFNIILKKSFVLILEFLFVLSLLKLLFLITNIRHSSLIVENLLSIALLFLIITPIFLVIPKIYKIKYWIVKFLLFFLIFVISLPISFAFLISVADLSMNNGFRQIYKEPYKNNTYFSEYLTPDQGAFGGSQEAYSIDEDLIFGFKKIFNIEDFKILYDTIAKSSSILINGKDTIVFKEEFKLKDPIDF